jgi:hypothetical protein
VRGDRSYPGWAGLGSGKGGEFGKASAAGAEKEGFITGGCGESWFTMDCVILVSKNKDKRVSE